MSSFHFVFFSISSFYLYSFHLQLLSCYFSQDFQLCIEDDLRNWSCYWLYWQCFEFFPHSVQCGLQVCYMWPLLWWFQFFYSCFVQNFYEERMLHFITTLFLCLLRSYDLCFQCLLSTFSLVFDCFLRIGDIYSKIRICSLDNVSICCISWLKSASRSLEPAWAFS